MILTPQEGDKLSLLRQLEGEAKTGYDLAQRGANQMAIAIHRIFTEKLYLAELDENGLPAYPSQSDYEPHLLESLGISRATLYNYYTPIKIACGPSFDLSYEEFESTGGKKVWAMVKDIVPYDERTGAVDIQNPNELMRTLISISEDDAKGLTFRPTDIRGAIKESVGIVDTPPPLPVKYILEGLWLVASYDSNRVPLVDTSELHEAVRLDLLTKCGIVYKGEQ
jgi:hypothetical protein